MIKIAIVGCGWLGLPLAKKLLDKGFKVIGTTTSQDKLAKLNTYGIDAHLLNLDAPVYNANFLKDCDTLFLNIPPGLRSNPSGSFLKKLSRFLEHIKTSNIKKVVYINSTAVYPSSGVFDETSKIIPDSAKGKELLASEELISNYFKDTTTLRLGGLFGPERHPSKFVRSAQQLVVNSTANLIHLDDAVNLSYAALTNELPCVINGVHPDYTDKYSFYKKALACVGQDFPYPTPTSYTQRVIQMKTPIEFSYCYDTLEGYL